jgi:hypothetical protein
MYIVYNNNVYIQNGDKIVGVEIYSDKTIIVDGTEIDLPEHYDLLTPFEIQCRYNIKDGGEYKFPRKSKVSGVEENGTVEPTKTTTRKSNGK